MATSTNTRNSDRQASYQPGGDYESWDNERGSSTHSDNGRGYGSSDNGRDYSSGHDNGGFYNGDKGAATQDAVDRLRDAENGALSKQEPSFYTGKGGRDNDRGNNGVKNKGKGKGKGFFRNKGALITIVMLLAGGGAFLGASNSLLAPALSALMTSSTQTSFTSYSLRTKFIMKGMMNDAGGVVKQGWFGSLKYSKIPNYMKTRLAKYDIIVDPGGKSITWNGESMNADQFLAKYNTDVEFRETFTKAKRGRVATFFDNVADKIYKKLGISRNLFSKYKQTNDLDTDVGNYKNTMEPKFEGSTTSLRTNAESEEIKETETVIKDGQEVEVEVDKTPPPINSEADSTTGSAKDIEVAKEGARSMISSIAGTVGKVGSAVCTVLKVGSMIATAAAAQEMYNSINYFMGQLESISKMKAGYGDASAVNSLLNFLSTSETTETEDFDGFRFHFPNLSSDSVPSTSEDSMSTKTETGSPLEASGLLKMMTNAPVTSANTQNYSLERTIKVMGGAAAFGAGTALTCAGVDLINSIMSLAVTVIPGGGLVKIVGSFLSRFVVNLVVSALVAQFFSFLVPTLAKVFFVNVFDNALGIPAGQFLAMGGSAANMREGRSGSGQSPSSKETVLAFNHSTNEVLAMEAEQDRYRLSPFDTTNPNTFFGSIAYSLLPTITSTNLTGLSSFLRSTSTSLASLLGRVSADGEGSSYLTTFGECPLLDEIGAVGDLYCNPIVTTDTGVNMIELDPSDETYAKVIMDSMSSCDESGDCKIDNDSNLAKYISYCDGRDSPFGVVDQNILGNLEMGNTVLNSIPVVGDILTVLNSATIEENLPWANGTRCGNTDKNSSFWNSEGKYYQRYVEDQRILEQMGAYEGSQNPVVAYEEAFEAAHPTDDTYIGYLSRISGLTPENTEIMLAFVLYYDFVENYDPTVRIAMEGDTSDVKNGEEVAAEIRSSMLRFDDNDEFIEESVFEDVIKNSEPVYADARNRSFAIA